MYLKERGIFGFLYELESSFCFCGSVGHSGEGGQRRDPQGHVLPPVLGLRAEQIHCPGLLEQLNQRLQPGQLRQAADAAH